MDPSSDSSRQTNVVHQINESKVPSKLDEVIEELKGT